MPTANVTQISLGGAQENAGTREGTEVEICHMNAPAILQTLRAGQFKITLTKSSRSIVVIW